MRMHMCMRMCESALVRKYTEQPGTGIHMRPHMHTHTHTHTYAHAPTHTHAYAYAYACVHAYSRVHPNAHAA